MILALLSTQELSCGGLGGDPQTCVAPKVSYQGNSAGAAFLKISGDRGLAINDSAVSFAFLSAAVNGSTFCYRTGDPSAQTIKARAWIDTSGAAPANCVDVSNSACEPSPLDPQAHQAALLRWGETNLITLVIASP